MKKTLNEKFNRWLQSPTGSALQRIEYKMLKKLKQAKQIDTLLMVGEPEQERLCKAFQAKQTILVTSHFSQQPKNSSLIYANADELPIRPNSMDFILLPHTLDFNKSLHHILSEANILLKPEGYMVILGFNPYSLWGLRRLFTMRINTPWCGNFYPLWQLRDSLTVLNYDILTSKKFIYRPHARRFGLFNKMAFLEAFFRILFPFSGAVYLVVAKKKVYGVTPLRSSWQQVSKVITNGAISSTRSITTEREQY